MAGQHGSTGGESRPAGWHGGQMVGPVVCDVCTKVCAIGTDVVDGKTTQGPWGKMCEDCFVFYGVGLGTGKGQMYRLVGSLASKVEQKMTYPAWMARVDAEIRDISGVGSDEIGDWDYRSSWEAGDVPAEAAREALEAASFPFED